MKGSRLSKLSLAADRVAQLLNRWLSDSKRSWVASASEAWDPEIRAEMLVARLADPTSRRDRQDELRHIGRPAVAPLIKALRDESLHPFAEVVLIELGPLAEPQLNTLASRGHPGAQQTLKRMGKW